MLDNTIIFLDDSFWCHLDSCEYLRSIGLNVAEAYSAADAIALIGEHTDLSGLVTDIELGDGPNGFEVARIARTAYPHLPVVYISGTAAGRHELEGVNGAEFISKPFLPQQIVEALSRAIYLEAA